MKKQLGVLGGTFDPVHLGHIELAEAALAEGIVERIMFVPAARPPHKKAGGVSGIRHRLNMLALVSGLSADFFVSELEVHRAWPSYTIETLEQLANQTQDAVELWFIIGSDAFLEIETWHRWHEVIRSTSFLIARRQGFATDAVKALLSRNAFLPQDPDKNVWHRQEAGNKVIFLRQTTRAVSSTEIRQRIGENKPWQHLVLPAVGRYIEQNRLYR